MSDNAAGNETDHPDMVMFPPFIAGGLLLLAVVLEWPLRLRLLPRPGSVDPTIIGLILLGIAIWIVFAARHKLMMAGTHVNPRHPTSKIVTDGPYQYSRNPIYLGFILAFLGLGFLFSLDWTLLFAPALVIIMHYGVVLPEEDYLTGKFGEQYLSFKRKTQRWL